MKNKITVAIATKPYGNKGWIKVQGYSEHVCKFFEDSDECSFRVGNDEKVFEITGIEAIEGTPNFAIKLKGIDSIDAADMFRSFEMIVPYENACKINDMDTQAGYIGWKVVFSNSTQGVVKEMLSSASGEFLKVQLTETVRRKDILVPANEDFISEIDSEKEELKIIHIEDPYEF